MGSPHDRGQDTCRDGTATPPDLEMIDRQIPNVQA